MRYESIVSQIAKDNLIQEICDQSFLENFSGLEPLLIIMDAYLAFMRLSLQNQKESSSVRILFEMKFSTKREQASFLDLHSGTFFTKLAIQMMMKSKSKKLIKSQDKTSNNFDANDEREMN